MTSKLKIPMLAGWHINLVAEKLNEIIVAMTASGDLTGVSLVSVHSDFQTSGAIRALRAIHVSLGIPFKLNKSCDFNSCELVRIINNVIQILSVTLTYSEMILASEPTRYYRLGEDTGTDMVDEISGKDGGYSGGVLDSPSLLASGDGASYNANGSSNSTMFQDGDFNVGTGDFSLMFMFKANTAVDSQFIIDLRQNDNIGWFVLTGGYGGSLSGGLRFTNDVFDAVSTIAINNGGIYHCICMRKNGVATAEVNGGNAGSDADITNYNRATGHISIGHNGFAQGHVDAKLQELVYYKRALTNVERAAFAAKALGL